MGAVEREFRAAALAIARLVAHMEPDPTVLHSASVVQADMRNCRRNVENTYLVRLFAVFEEALREIRRVVYKKRGPIQAHLLIERCASRQKVRSDDLQNVHRVREYRNAILHAGSAAPVTLPQARAWLCKFFGSMPKQW
jgi:hypothetical protein